jgi:hypothetical protein
VFRLAQRVAQAPHEVEEGVGGLAGGHVGPVEGSQATVHLAGRLDQLAGSLLQAWPLRKGQGLGHLVQGRQVCLEGCLHLLGFTGSLALAALAEVLSDEFDSSFASRTDLLDLGRHPPAFGHIGQKLEQLVGGLGRGGALGLHGSSPSD